MGRLKRSVLGLRVEESSTASKIIMPLSTLSSFSGGLAQLVFCLHCSSLDVASGDKRKAIDQVTCGSFYNVRCI